MFFIVIVVLGMTRKYQNLACYLPASEQSFSESFLTEFQASVSHVRFSQTWLVLAAKCYARQKIILNSVKTYDIRKKKKIKEKSS